MRRTPYLKALFSGTGRREEPWDRTVRAFYEKSLYRTKGNTGVLFFISLLERKVWILADKGIHEKITQAKLNALARTVSGGIRQGNAADALARAIGEAGRLLEEHFPTVKDDTNELTDEVITSDRETV